MKATSAPKPSTADDDDDNKPISAFKKVVKKEPESQSSPKVSNGAVATTVKEEEVDSDDEPINKSISKRKSTEKLSVSKTPTVSKVWRVYIYIYNTSVILFILEYNI